MKFAKIIAVVSLALAVHAANASDSYLYWMVSGANYNGVDVEFDYATIRADGGDYLNLYSSGQSESDTILLGSDSGARNYSAGANNNIGMYAGFDGTVTSFLVELWESSERVAYQTYAWSEVLAHITTTAQNGSVTPYVVTSVIPEPTSGLLSLFGLAALALRRRRRA